MGMTELALLEDPASHQVERLEAVKHSANSLLDIINDILDISKIEADKFELDNTTYNFAELLESVIRITAVKAHEKNLELMCDYDLTMPETFDGDPLRIKQIMLNLVGNAIKFTDSGEITIKVRYSRHKYSHDCINISVEDSGIGIPPEDATKIFNAFQQIDSSTSRRFGGTGLGLAIAKRLISMMGGAIAVESIPEKGSTFTLTLPVSSRGKPASKSGRNKPASFPLPISCFIVSPNSKMKRILSNYIRAWGGENIHTSSPSRALSSFSKLINENTIPDAVIIDTGMTDIDGITLAKSLANLRQESRDSIILMSTALDCKHREFPENTRYFQRVLKPMMPHYFYSTIIDIISGKTISGNIDRNSKKSSASAICDPVNYSILLAEDNVINRNLASQLLRKKGWEVWTVENGMMALDIAKQNKFDLILMDIQMPVMDGLEATERIRKFEKHTGAYTPIVALTAHAMKGDKERCINAGMDDYIPKPINPSEMFKIIEKTVISKKNSC